MSGVFSWFFPVWRAHCQLHVLEFSYHTLFPQVWFSKLHVEVLNLELAQYVGAFVGLFVVGQKLRLAVESVMCFLYRLKELHSPPPVSVVWS